jgi:hypothetical protein
MALAIDSRPLYSRPTLALLLFASLTLIFAGCNDHSRPGNPTQSTLPEGYVAPKSTDHLPLVDYPEYVNWNQFPVGTSVIRKKEVTNDFGLVRVTTKLSLREKSSEKVIVESQVTVDRPGEPLVENPRQEMQFAAQFRLPEGMQLEQFQLPSLKAKQTGEESIEVANRQFTAQLFTWNERNETGPMAVEYWRADEVPGRMLRQTIEGHQHHSLEQVVEIHIPTDAQQPDA